MDLTQNQQTNKPKTRLQNKSIGSVIILSLCCSLLGTQAAEAASFTFTEIANTQDDLFMGYTSWNGAINDQGTVAFYAGSGGGDGGIFTVDKEKKISTLLNQEILADFFPNPYGPGAPPASYFIRPFVDINDQNIVAFTGIASFLGGFDSRQRIFISDNNIIKTVTEFSTSGRLESRALVDLNINNQNSLTTRILAGGAFLAPTDTISLYKNIAQQNLSVTTLAQGSWDNFSKGGLINLGSPSLNNQGTVAFSALFRDINAEYPTPPYQSQLIIQKGNSQTVVANNIRLSSQPVINDNNEIAFLSPDFGIEQGIFTLKNGNLTKAVNTQGLFSSFDSLDINNKGEIAFSAILDTGKKGIFIGADPVTDKVIGVGDSLFGSTIIDLNFFGDKGLNNNGQIAFFAALADGTKGIFRADPSSVPSKPVPEPTSIFSLLALGLGSLSGLRRSR